MKSPLVTIIIPTYNQADYLEDAIKSALKQDYANLEIIIADDCSSDATPQIVKIYAGDGRLKYYRNETNLGKTANYRRSLYEFASGEWVLNLDGDDYLTDESYISFAIQQINRYHNVVLFTAGVKSISEKSFRLPHIHRLVEEQIFTEGINLFLNWHRYKIPHLTSIYHRQTACRIGFYDIDISSTDWESMLRLVLNGNVILSEKIAGVWRKHKNNLSQAMDVRQFEANFAFITKPMEYALSKGYDKTILESWKKTMTETVIRSQFNEIWINVIRKHNFSEMLQFIRTVKNKQPEFVNNFFQPKNFAYFLLYFPLLILTNLKLIARRGIG